MIAEHFDFHKRDQSPGESIAEFDAVLRNLATHCQFIANLADNLRDIFVCGLVTINMDPRKNGPPSYSMDAAGAIFEPDLIRDVFLYPSIGL